VPFEDDLRRLVLEAIQQFFHLGLSDSLESG
jgi:hypothetical protein